MLQMLQFSCQFPFPVHCPQQGKHNSKDLLFKIKDYVLNMVLSLNWNADCDNSLI